MISILILSGCFVLAIVGSELLLRGTKIQTGLFRILMVHVVIFLLSAFYFLQTGRGGLLSLVIFWMGAFLTWFGVRSHVESSILLRMLYLLSKQAMPPAKLLAEYEAHYGENLRIAELLRSGLIQNGAEGITITPKGKLILNAVSKLT